MHGQWPRIVLVYLETLNYNLLYNIEIKIHPGASEPDNDQVNLLGGMCLNNLVFLNRRRKNNFSNLSFVYTIIYANFQ